MKKLEMNEMESLQGGTVVEKIGGVSCGLALLWPIGTAIFGPTCAGMLIATAAGY